MAQTSLAIINIFCVAALALVSDVRAIQRNQKNIAQLASNDPELSTLVTALKAANLTATLSGGGSFTVFAPTNKAFSLIPEATLAHLLDPANVKELQSLLEYHVLFPAIQSKELKESSFERTIEGRPLVLENRSGELIVNDALAIFVDLQASNGVVHIIDQVLLPTFTSDLNLIQLVASKPELSTFATALKAGLLTGALEGNGRLQRFQPIWATFVDQCAYGTRGPSIFHVPSEGAQCPFTVIAPSNEAFAKLPKATLDHLLDPKNIGELQKILEYHIIPGVVLKAGRSTEVPSNAFTFQGFYSTLLGNTNLNSQRDDNGTTLLSPDVFYKPNLKPKTSAIIQANLGASNGIVHVIDNVLIPHAPTRTIFEGLVATGTSTATGTFVTALKAGLLERTLNDPASGPYTVFVPTDYAFAKLPKGTLDHLLDPKNIGELQNILEYHIIPGVALRTGCRNTGRTCGQGDLEANGFINTLAGKDVTITTAGEVGVDGTVRIDKSNTIPFEGSYADGTGQSDRIASNGIWQMIDQVLMPALVSTI